MEFFCYLHEFEPCKEVVFTAKIKKKAYFSSSRARLKISVDNPIQNSSLQGKN